MYNIIKSLNFTNRRNMVIVITIISMIVMPLLIPTAVLSVPFKDITGGAYLTNLSGELFTVWVIAIMIISCKIVMDCSTALNVPNALNFFFLFE